MSFEKGTTVARRSAASEIGVVIDGPTRRRGQTWYVVFFGGNRESVLEEDLRPVSDAKGPEGQFREGAFGDQRAFSRLVTLAKINEPVRDTIYSYQASRTELHGYQYKPLLKYLSSPFRRILIADEVGLGKTIEAGYILQEERARHDLQRVLVVCPASLRVKWQNEMYQRFGIRFDILRADGVRRRMLAGDTMPALGQGLYAITSFATIRSKSVRSLLQDNPPTLDLLIVDEVHHCRNRETHNFRTIRTLAEGSDSVVFLSATPVHTGNGNLFNLMNLLVPERFEVEAAFFQQLEANRHVIRAERLLCEGTEEAIRAAREELGLLGLDPVGRRVTEDPYYALVMARLEGGDILDDTAALVETQEMLGGLNLLGDVLTRTRRKDVQEDSAIRSAHSITPSLSAYEQQIYDMLSEFIYVQYERRYNSAIARFVLSGLQRQIASSLYAAVKHYQEGFQQRQGGVGATADSQDLEEPDSESEAEDEDSESESSYSLWQDEEFRGVIDAIALSRLKDEDTKYAALKELLSHGEKVIIFAFYKRSLRYLEERLAAEGIPCVRIDGDVPSNPEEPERDERTRRIEIFRTKPNCRVMLSSQVGSEGLDFQFCSSIVNWDLPWNPMVVEQRIGRIDRIGQTSDKIFIHSLVSKGTIEELILERLYLRIGIFKDSIGDLEPILGTVMQSLRPTLLSRELSRDQKEQRIRQSAVAVENQRRSLQSLEEKSVQLIGHEEVLRRKIESIHTLGRYLTGKELEVFVGQFLVREYPASELQDSRGRRPSPEDTGPRLMHVCSELRGFATQGVARADEEGQRFIHLLRREKLKLAFDAPTALAHSDAELIHSHHPFVKLIAGFYTADRDRIHPASTLRAASSAVEPGIYFYGLASIDEHGVFEGRRLRLELLRCPDAISIDDQEAQERLLHDMVTRGVSWDDGRPEADDGDCNELVEWLRDRLAKHVQEYRGKRNREAEALELRQLRALEASHRVKRGWREKALATASGPGGHKRMIPAHEGQIRKLDADFEIASAKLQSRKGVTVSYRIESVGWVDVVKSLT